MKYVVEYTLKCHVFVDDAKDESEAYAIAEDEADFGDCDMLEGTARVVRGDEADRARRHADVVVNRE